MSLPLTGETVSIEYLSVDELEATCWLKEYSVVGYLDNEAMNIKLNDIGAKDIVQITSIDNDTGRIELKSFRF